MSENDIRAGFLRHRAASEHHFEAARSASGDYSLHRAGSLIHHYFSLLEDPAHPITGFSELFAADFNLDFTMTQIATFADFADWLASTRTSVDALTISVSDLEVADAGDGVSIAQMDIELDAISHDGTERAMSTRHVWTIVDHAEDRFAKIESMVVKLRS